VAECERDSREELLDGRAPIDTGGTNKAGIQIKMQP